MQTTQLRRTGAAFGALGGGAVCGSGGPHSFTGSTGVVMADGSTKPIAEVKVGDKVKDSVPGAKGTETHTVQKVIVTTTDHDFVDVTVAPAGSGSAAGSASASASAHRPAASGAGAGSGAAAAPSLGKKVLRKAALGLAASAAVVTAGLGIAHHGAPASTPVAYTAPVATATAAGTPANGTAAGTAGVAADVAAGGAADGAADVTAKGNTLTTTYHHPFYDETQAGFVDADHLHPGDLLQTPTGTARITTVRLYHATTTTYDLTINGLHTYYVVAGGTPILVHNVDEGRLCDVTLGPVLNGQTAQGVSAQRGDTVLHVFRGFHK